MICLERAWMTISSEIPFNSEHMNSMCMYACMVCFLLWTYINLLTWVLSWNLSILIHSPHTTKTSPWGFEQSPAYECLCFCFANKLNSNFSSRPRRLSNSDLSQPFQPYLLPDFPCSLYCNHRRIFLFSFCTPLSSDTLFLSETPYIQW